MKISEHEDPYDLGLQADLNMWLRSPADRRKAIRLGVASLTTLLVGCSTGTANNPANNGACVSTIPSETNGPYPADGSSASGQQLNVLTRSGIVRSDIRKSLSSGNTAEGVPLALEITLVNTNNNCALLEGYAIYVWHCTRDGNYSLYSSGFTAEDYLRGVQATNSSGKATFNSIFPGCYAGRWPHIHFEIYPSLAKATGAANAVKTSQIAFPEDACKAVYAASSYGSSSNNLSKISLATDNVFSDGYSLEMATLSGNSTDGYTAKITVGVAV